jgi:16S rRNA (cytidine1402-2'-O)-methyltransferase
VTPVTDDGSRAAPSVRAASAPALFLVATPIGNLDDLTLRAIRTLGDARVIAAEDTRRTRALLSHLGIQGKHLVSLDAHATPENIDWLLDNVEQGAPVCLVTDAGMPTISDPGSAVVRRAGERGLPVVVIPGPSAVTSAVAASGLVDRGFVFLGFLPRKGEKRRHVIAEIVLGLRPTVFFESPHRLGATLVELAEHAPEREACVARELTKLHEQVLVSSLGRLATLPNEWRGEVTVVVAASPPLTDEDEMVLDWAEIDARIAASLRAGGTAKSVARELAAALGLSKKELYSRVLDVRAAESPER